MAAFTVTYDIVTPDSAEHGDVAESGFVDASGHQYELEPEVFCAAAAAFKKLHGLRLRDAIDLIGCLDCGSHGYSYYEADGRCDYRTGAETRFAFHLPRNATPASVKRVARLLRARKLI